MGTLHSDRIHLRPIVKDDLPMLNEWKNNEDVYKFLGGGYSPVSIDIQAKWLDSLIDTTGNDRRFIICENGSLRPLGMIGLYGINFIHRTCELGIFIGETDHHRQGIGTEAYRMLESHAVKYLALRKIKAWVVEDNTSALKMYEKLGFSIAGELQAERYIDGEFRDLWLMEKFIQ